MGKRILNRKELRADFDAAERQKPGDEDVTDEEVGEEEEDEDEDDEEKEDKPEGDEDEEAAAAGDDEDEDAAPVPKKKKAAKAAKVPKVAKPKSRKRVAKVTRMRVVWGVFNNSHQCIATYEYPKRAEADAHVAKLIADKKTTHFVQPVKEPIEEKQE
jgi:cobalamin biosynthesis protein CobT